MPLPRKPDLIRFFESSLRESNVKFLRLTPETQHPAEFHILTDPEPYRIRLYIWNLTFGGRRSLPDELRIQVTGLPEINGHQQFVPLKDGKTILLGWSSEFRVFAAYDVDKHLGALGGSPSIQIRRHALEAARVNGISQHFKGEQQVAFAIKPRYMGIYLSLLEELHACGSSEETLELLETIFINPTRGTDLPDALSQRRYAIVEMRKALRDAGFRNRVITAYSNSCAMCGIQLRLIDAAHILPAAHPESSDETINGIALCALHHRAYDGGLVTFDSAFRIHNRKTLEEELCEAGLDGGLAEFREGLFPTIEVPPDRDDRPSAKFVDLVNQLRGWNL